MKRPLDTNLPPKHLYKSSSVTRTLWSVLRADFWNNVSKLFSKSCTVLSVCESQICRIDAACLGFLLLEFRGASEQCFILDQEFRICYYWTVNLHTDKSSSEIRDFFFFSVHTFCTVLCEGRYQNSEYEHGNTLTHTWKTFKRTKKSVSIIGYYWASCSLYSFQLMLTIMQSCRERNTPTSTIVSSTFRVSCILQSHRPSEVENIPHLCLLYCMNTDSTFSKL